MRATHPSLRHVPGGERIFQRMYTRLDCTGRPPQFVVEFYPYASLAHSIRIREEVAYVRLSDMLRNAPREILEAAAALLLSRLYRRRPPRELVQSYREYSHAHGTRKRLHAMRRKRARRKLAHFRGQHHDLALIFHELNHRYFGEALPRPKLGWSARPWRSQLGSFDPALGQIAINRALDGRDVPKFVVAYVLFHEMLHQKHPMKFARCRLESHSHRFREEEKHFHDYERAMKFLERFA
ncbi:MAG TPA: hypothetical protein VGT03_02470 [Candidatus Acidoferrales bacterium]|nr:hypothetical protein [Candidatus Acidoferrales bacterium]